MTRGMGSVDLNL